MKNKAEKHYVIRFAVEGLGQFPVDMLRYDRCVPVSEGDSHTIERGPSHRPRRVMLERISRNDAGPTVGRWASFGWRVLDHTLEINKEEYA